MMRAVFLATLLCFSSAEDHKYLLISTPSMGKVVYINLRATNTEQTKPLIDSGLSAPEGLAVEQSKKILYVADPELKAIYRYQLLVEDGELLQDGTRQVAAQNVEARWIAVDGVGNLFFTDESANTISFVSANKLRGGVPTPEILYNGATVAQVSSPGGIAADNFHIYWSNKSAGVTVGSVIRGLEDVPNESVLDMSTLAQNAMKVYGVCLSQNNVFYTNEEQYVYGVKKTGGGIGEVSDQFVKPRGCTWDGDGTVFVADRDQNAVYSFASNMRAITAAHRTKVVECDDAFGLAIISRGATPYSLIASAVLMMLMT